MSDVESRLAPGRMKTYRGEDRARIACPATLLDGSEEAAQAYVDRITRSAWWKRTCVPSTLGDQFGGRRVQVPAKIIVIVHRGAGAWAWDNRRKHGTYWRPEIRLGRKPGGEGAVCGWTQASADPYVILHEVAHVMANCHGGESGHGRIFRWYMAMLVARWMGPEHGRALKAGYEAEGLKWRKPKR